MRLDSSVQVRIPQWNFTFGLCKCSWLLLSALWCFPTLPSVLELVTLNQNNSVYSLLVNGLNFTLYVVTVNRFLLRFAFSNITCKNVSCTLYLAGNVPSPLFHVLSAFLIVQVFHILWLFFPVMPFLCIYTSCLLIRKNPSWLQLFLYNKFYHYISGHASKKCMLFKIADQFSPHF